MNLLALLLASEQTIFAKNIDQKQSAHSNKQTFSDLLSQFQQLQTSKKETQPSFQSLNDNFKAVKDQVKQFDYAKYEAKNQNSYRKSALSDRSLESSKGVIKRYRNANIALLKPTIIQDVQQNGFSINDRSVSMKKDDRYTTKGFQRKIHQKTLSKKSLEDTHDRYQQKSYEQKQARVAYESKQVFLHQENQKIPKSINRPFTKKIKSKMDQMDPDLTKSYYYIHHDKNLTIQKKANEQQFQQHEKRESIGLANSENSTFLQLQNQHVESAQHHQKVIKTNKEDKPETTAQVVNEFQTKSNKRAVLQHSFQNPKLKNIETKNNNTKIESKNSLEGDGKENLFNETFYSANQENLFMKSQRSILKNRPLEAKELSRSNHYSLIKQNENNTVSQENDKSLLTIDDQTKNPLYHALFHQRFTHLTKKGKNMIRQKLSQSFQKSNDRVEGDIKQKKIQDFDQSFESKLPPLSLVESHHLTLRSSLSQSNREKPDKVTDFIDAHLNQDNQDNHSKTEGLSYDGSDGNLLENFKKQIEERQKQFVRIKLDQTQININLQRSYLQLHFTSLDTFVTDGIDSYIEQVMQEHNFNNYQIKIKDREKSVVVESKKGESTQRNTRRIIDVKA